VNLLDKFTNLFMLHKIMKQLRWDLLDLLLQLNWQKLEHHKLLRLENPLECLKLQGTVKEKLISFNLNLLKPHNPIIKDLILITLFQLKQSKRVMKDIVCNKYHHNLQPISLKCNSNMLHLQFIEDFNHLMVVHHKFHSRILKR
jgi:hypothetical protein